ncbi:Torsin-1A [Anabarilius grahami]|uniref:Torsin-1A n=1 Tax=Anabarilius grahami TaxID=495550 RepID=A0A3N0Z1K9_ANAGA|nr:Torsin-1A [Anabarilius grahami]
MDTINFQLIDVSKPFLDYNTRVDGVSFRNAIFIFLSNAGGSLIVDMALDFWREGKKREDLWINSKELETKIFNDKNSLEADLRDFLFGQHIASDVVLKAVTSFMTDSKPNKPLVLSFHGTSGVGKTHVTKIIAKNLYEKGDDSDHVHKYISTYRFPHKEKLDLYRENLKQWIRGNVSSFPRSMFIFDEMDKMHPQLIDVIKPFLDYNARVDGVSFRNAIFIFLGNAGGQVISEVALDFMREGRNREEITMNSKELEIKISQSIMNEKSGFSHSSLIDHHVIDHYIPFLPLELKHVRLCVLVEMMHLNMNRDIDLADKVAREMPFFPEREKIFSVKGCRSIRQKLVLY